VAVLGGLRLIVSDEIPTLHNDGFFFAPSSRLRREGCYPQETPPTSFPRTPAVYHRLFLLVRIALPTVRPLGNNCIISNDGLGLRAVDFSSQFHGRVHICVTR